MENQTGNEKKVQELKEKMDDKNFELDIDSLEDAAGGEYVYVDTSSEEFRRMTGTYYEDARR